MKHLAVICLLFAVASAGLIPATTFLRTPSLDSAVIKSERLGGNFAYSSVEGHSYAAVAPVVQHVATPVAVSYHAHAPVVTGYTAHVGAPTFVAAAPAYAHHGYPLHAYPALGFAPAVIGEAPVATPVAEAPAPVEAAPAPAADAASDSVEVEAA
ncbi:uncharacterized protein LOC124165687 [Ischnura elegans]|uniref:uncharacterized protein LOC124165687 n=1 Tax=Ischnura elegans TaxID=197161 RepID=UPI001ED873AB|nr:uncharacterized protein LOC124165687 [Ischnura elegans]